MRLTKLSKLMLGLLLLLLALSACGGSPGKRPITPDATSKGVLGEGPGRPTVVLLHRNPTQQQRGRVFFRDFAVAAESLGVFFTVVSDTVPMPIGVFKNESGAWTQTGIVDLPSVTNAESGLVFAKDGATPTYQPLGSNDDMLRAASTYLGLDLASAMPWRLVLVILDGNEEIQKQYTEVSQLLQERNIYVHSWRKGDPTPMQFPSETSTVGSLDPTSVTDAASGWIFAEKGRQPMYVAAGPYAETVRAMSTYFNMEFQALKARAGVTDARAGAGPSGRKFGQPGVDITKRKSGGKAPMKRGKRKAAME